jgi:predicted RNA methylase
MAGNPRSTGLEQCYTPRAAADVLTGFFLDVVGADPGLEWIEPAAGSGSFVQAARRRGVHQITALDIDPKGTGIDVADFLSPDVAVTAKVCLTNPPFGRNHALSIPFFNKLATSCDLIGFVVPRSWRKWSIVNRLDRNFVKIADWDLALTYVDAAGFPLTVSRTLNTIFQVWARAEQPRPTAPEPTPSRRFHTVAPEAATAAITQFGRGCGTVRTSFPRKANTTQLFTDADAGTVSLLASLDLFPFYTQVAYIEALSRVEIDFALDADERGCVIPADFLTVSNLVEHPIYRIARPDQRTGRFDFTAMVDTPG